MSKITSNTPSTIDSGRLSGQSLNDTLLDAGLPQTANIPVPLDVSGQEQLITMIAIMRQPPRMPAAGIADGALGSDGSTVDDVAIEQLGGLPTFDVAFKVGELLVRREAEVAESGDLGAMRGMLLLSEHLRMFEHLHILQTNPKW